MGKKRVRDIAGNILRYFLLGFIIVLILSPLALGVIKAYQISGAANRKLLVNIGLTTLVLGLLWLALWIARRRSLRVSVLYERYSPDVSQIGRRILAVWGGFAFLLGGAYQTFLTPDQEAVVWEHIRDQPELDAEGIRALPRNSRLFVTGTLSGNALVSPEDYVFFIQDEWWVTPCNIAADEECTDTSGLWLEITWEIPGLFLEIPGGTVQTVPVPNVILEGLLQEKIGPPAFQSILLMADYNGVRLADGALRTRGLHNGDFLTVVGRKSDSDGIIPSHLIGGGRAQMEAYFNSYEKAVNWVRISGVILMIASPFVTILIWKERD